MSHIKTNPAAERAVLAAIARFGADAYYDVSDIVNESTFTVDSNQFIYKCIRHIFESDPEAKLDLPSVYAAANDLKIDYVFNKPNEAKYLQAIFNFPADPKNIRRFAGQISKLEFIRELDHQLVIARDNLGELTGEESLTKILSVAEDAVFDLPNLLRDDHGPRLIGDGIVDYLKFVEENKVDSIGIQTGFKEYDEAIGGGLRTGVNIIAARMKVGKSFIAANIGNHITSQGIPVLYMDTEMHHEDQMPRILGITSQVGMKDIETGKFAVDHNKKQKLYNSATKISEQPLWYMNISGTSFEEQAAIMRRWLCKNVGLKPDGTAKKCAIIYDYVKLMDDSSLKNMQEYQAIGFLMTSLHNFTAKYKVPMLGLCQTNRDGIDHESTSVFAQSDRIGWLCVSGSIYKLKSDEEIAQDGPENGNRKLVVLVSRYGPGTTRGDYINYKFDDWCGRISEIGSHGQIQEGSCLNEGGFEVTNVDDEIPFDA